MKYRQSERLNCNENERKEVRQNQQKKMILFEVSKKNLIKIDDKLQKFEGEERKLMEMKGQKKSLNFLDYYRQHYLAEIARGFRLNFSLVLFQIISHLQINNFREFEQFQTSTLDSIDRKGFPLSLAANTYTKQC